MFKTVNCRAGCSRFLLAHRTSRRATVATGNETSLDWSHSPHPPTHPPTHPYKLKNEQLTTVRSTSALPSRLHTPTDRGLESGEHVLATRINEDPWKFIKNIGTQNWNYELKTLVENMNIICMKCLFEIVCKKRLKMPKPIRRGKPQFMYWSKNTQSQS